MEQADRGQQLVPKLRFPEFRETAAWDSLRADAIFKTVNQRANGANLPILAITQEQGAIPRDLIDYHVSVKKSSLESYKTVRNGDFIISLRSFQGGIEYSKYDGICSPAYIVLRLTRKECKDFFRHYLKSNPFILEMNKNIEGIRDGKMVSFAQFSELYLPVPSHEEQQRVATCLTSADEVISAQTTKLKALADHKAGLMQQLFPGVGETVPRFRFPEFQDGAEWDLRTIGQICDVVQGYGFPEAMQGRTHGDYAFCKVSDISRAVSENGGNLSAAANYVDHADLKKIRAKLVPAGSTVFAKIGEALRLNRRAITQFECLIDNNATGIKAKANVADDYFIYNLSKTIDMNDYCAGAVPSVNKSTLEGIVVRIPDLPEQERVADCLRSINALISAEGNKLRALKDQKAGLTQQLFPSLSEA